MKSVYYFCQSGVKKLTEHPYRLCRLELDIEAAILKNVTIPGSLSIGKTGGGK